MLAEIKGWGWLILFVANGFILWAGWSLSKKFTPREDCAAQHAKDNASMQSMGKTMNTVEQKCAGLETSVKNMPTTGDVHELRLDVQNLRGEISTMKAEHNALKEIMIRVENNVTLLVRGHMRTDA